MDTTVEEYERRSQLVVRQYDQYVVIDSLRLDGRSTVGENIADIGGLTLAWLAFQRATAGQPRIVVDGFTPEQRFFLAFAQTTFRRAIRPEQLRLDALRGGHSVPKWRVNGPLTNLPAFALAFGCREGDPMVLPRALRGNIW